MASYDLAITNQSLVERWRGEGRDRMSLRELATFFNERLLDAALESAGASRIDGEVGNLYRVLTADDVSSGVRTQARRQLETEGVSVETVEDHFLSHQTIHTHLTECLDVSRNEPSKDPSERRRANHDRIRALQRRTEVVSTDALDRLRQSDALALDEFDVFVDVTVLCDECGTQSDIGKLLDQGGCQCRLDEPPQ